MSSMIINLPMVARRVRAWIETHILNHVQGPKLVARRVRAWIETWPRQQS